MRIGSARSSSALMRQSPLIRLTRGPSRHHELLLRALLSASPVRSAPPGTTAEAEEVLVELVVARCAGLDVAKDEVVACVRVSDGRGGRRQEVRTYLTFTSGLEALADWLAAEAVTQVVMEATGQYWKPGWQGVGGGGFSPHVVKGPPP